MLNETTGSASVNGTSNSKPMDTETLKRGIRVAVIGIGAIDRLWRRDVGRIRDQLAELHRSIEQGKPTEAVARFGLAREISDAAFVLDGVLPIASELADDVLGDYYADALNVDVWPLLSLANGLDIDGGLVSLIRMWCHGGAIELDEETERAMYEAAGLPYKRAKVIRRCDPVVVGDADDGGDDAG